MQAFLYHPLQKNIKAYFDGKYMEADNIEKTLENLLMSVEELAGKLKRENV